MKVLQELVKQVTPTRTRHISVLGHYPSGKPATIQEMFYQKLLDNEFKNDDEAAAFLYDSDASDDRYRKTKEALAQRMINTYLLIDPKSSGFTSLQTAHQQSYRDLAAAILLQPRGATATSLKLYKRVLKRAIKHEFTSLVLETTSKLRSMYAILGRNQRKFAKYNDIYHRWKSVYDTEMLGAELYAQLIAQYERTKEGRLRTAEVALAASEALAAQEPSFRTNYILFYFGFFKLVHLMCLTRYQDMLDMANELLTELDKQPNTSLMPRISFLSHKIMACIFLRRYEEGRQAAEECAKYSIEGSNNWFHTQQFSFMLAMHTQHYDEAYRIYRWVSSQPEFHKRPDAHRETWDLYHAYLRFLDWTGVIDIPDDRFRLSSFLNDVPKFSQEKRGMNIPILIIQILFLIKQRNYAAAEKRFEAIGKYCSRYVKRNDHFRSNCFIKMLLQIPKQGFHKTAAARHAKRYLEKLKSEPLVISEQLYEVEIIPYEELWELIYDSLENKRTYTAATPARG
jgi:hypothetical protein